MPCHIVDLMPLSFPKLKNKQIKKFVPFTTVIFHNPPAFYYNFNVDYIPNTQESYRVTTHNLFTKDKFMEICIYSLAV